MKKIPFRVLIIGRLFQIKYFLFKLLPKYYPMSWASGMPEKEGYFKVRAINLIDDLNKYSDVLWRNERLASRIYVLEDHIKWLENKIEELKNEIQKRN